MIKIKIKIKKGKKRDNSSIKIATRIPQWISNSNL